MAPSILTLVQSGEALDVGTLDGTLVQTVAGNNGSTVIEMLLPDGERHLRRIYHVREGLETVRQAFARP